MKQSAKKWAGMIEDVETHWTSELNEEVEISYLYGGFSLYVGGQACYTDTTLDGIERWLGVYSMVKERV